MGGHWAQYVTRSIMNQVKSGLMGGSFREQSKSRLVMVPSASHLPNLIYEHFI